MKVSLALTTLLLSSLLYSAAAKTGDKPGKGSGKSDLRETPPVELPAKAAEAVSKAEGADKDKVAHDVISTVAENHAASLPSVVAAIAAAAPTSAATAAGAAAKVAPAQADIIASAAAQAAPAQANAIVQAVIAQVPAVGAKLSGTSPAPSNSVAAQSGNESNFSGNPPPKTPPENRPTTTPGNINGNRPTIPPGLVRDPKPGRDDQHRYARP